MKNDVINSVIKTPASAMYDNIGMLREYEKYVFSKTLGQN